MIITFILVSAVCLAQAEEPEAAKRRLVWQGCGISQNSFMKGLATAYTARTGIEIDLSGGGATHGIRAVSSGEIDLGGSCRHALDFQQEKGSRLIPVAWDALVIVVHEDNPVPGLTQQQLAEVFSGRTTSWNELGAPESLGNIHVYAREGRLSGVGYMSRVMLFSDPNQDYAATHMFPSSGPLETALEEDPQGIAISGISSALQRRLRILDLDDVSPSTETIMSGTYPFVRPLFLVVPEDYRERPMIRDFVQWARSNEGQAEIRDTGAVPINEITGETWERYFSFMSEAKQDYSALERMLRELEEERQDP